MERWKVLILGLFAMSKENNNDQMVDVLIIPTQNQVYLKKEPVRTQKLKPQ